MTGEGRRVGVEQGVSGLRKLREALGDRFVAGIALTLGARSFTYEDRLYVMPVDRLWTPVP